MNDEYLFKIALDATDFNAALEAMRSMLGQVQEAVGGSIRQFTAADNALVKVQASITGATAAGGKMTAETRSMATGFSELLTKLKEASDAYKTFREEQVVGGKGMPSSPQSDVWAMSIASLREYLAISDAASASFEGEARRRISIEQQLTQQLESEDRKRIASHKSEYEAMVAADLAIEVAEKQRIQSAAAALTAEVRANRSAAIRATTVLAGSTTPYAGLANSAQRNTVGNAYTVRPSDGTGSQAELDASKVELANMATYYSAQEKENEAKRESVPLTNSQVDANGRLAASEERTRGALAATHTGLQRTSTELPRLRYALYDISTTFTILGAGMEAYGAGIAKVTSDYQTSFASVARTSKNVSQGALGQLKKDLVDLSTQIPTTFDDITKIATLGNQLNIPTEALTGFTKTVTEFAAASNTSTEVAATAFGRLGQIFKTTDYQGLGDQIAYLGVRAVATEADIIKVSQQIAVSANAYGISEKNTLALATAYASLGIRAESARGTTVRMLADLQKAVVQGGAGLSQIADVTGMSGAAFSKLFSSDANAGMTVFLQGLAKYGRDSKNVLAELGITAQRDITNIGLLSQNTNILTDAQKNATQAGGALQAMFDKQTNTISAQLTLAGNKFQSMLNDIGGTASGPLRGLVDLLNGLLNLLDRITKDPVAATTLVISAAVITLSGAFLVGTGLIAQYAASILAVRTYMQAMGDSGSTLGGILGAITGSTARAAAANVSYADSLRATASASQLEIVNAAALIDSRKALTVATEQENVAEAERNLEAAKGAGVREGIIAQEIALARAQADLNLALAQQGVAEGEAQLNAVKYTGTIDEVTFATNRLQAATLKLAAAQDEVALASRTSALAQQEGALSGLAAQTERNATASGRFAGALGKAGIVGGVLALLPLIPMAIDAMKEWRDSMTGAQTEADKLTSSILGLENAQANKASVDRIRSNLQYATGNAKYEDTQHGDQWTSTSGTRLAYNMATTGSYTQGDRVGPHSAGTVNTQGDEAAREYKTLDQALSDLVSKGQIKAAQAGFKLLTDGLNQSDQSAKVLSTLLPNLSHALNLTGNASIGAALAGKQSESAATKQARAFSTIVSAAFASGAATTLLEKDMGKLGDSFFKNGAKATIGGGALKTVIQQIYADTGGGPAAAAEMQALFNTLVKGGFASAAQLKPLADVIRQLTGGAKVVASSVPGISQMYDAWNKDAAAADKAAAATNRAAAASQAASRTLMDYGSDLNKVIGDMLTYQFGVGDASDKITQGWDTIKADAASARDSVKSIRADLLAIEATKATAQFALSVDQAYGDVTATAQDRAALAKANSDAAAKNKDLKKAQDASSTSLVGNSEAAIKNRQALEGQISSYQGYIVALAESGASQAQIDAAVRKSKAEFIAHATQLGLNRQQVDKLATAFDGMKTIINAIPRNITTGVTAKTSAAMKALADYRASIKQTNGMSVDTPVTPYVSPKDAPKKVGLELAFGITEGLRAQQLKNAWQIDQHDAMSVPPPSKPKPKPKPNPYGDWPGVDLHGLASGGWTGNGGIYDPAGIVHGQEFVLNAIGAKMLPMADLNAMNQGRAPHATQQTVVIAGNSKGGGFTAQDKMFLAQVLGAKPSISLSADQFGKAIDGANVRANLRGAG